jgi:hypothetical protein
MSKVWTQLPIDQFEAVKPDTVNKNIEAYIGEFNGKLNGLNMPVNSVTIQKLKLPQPEEAFVSGPVTKFNSVGSTQGYHFTRRSGTKESNLDIWTPLTTVNLKTDNWTRGWNDIALLNNWESFPMQFEAKEGMLVGCATIDWHHGTDMIEVTTDAGSTRVQGGFQWWSEWGVFVNDVLVARSGFIYPKRHTTQLPFSIPCGSQPISITVKWISNTGNLQAASGYTVSTAKPHGTVFDIFGATIWCRNNYR